MLVTMGYAQQDFKTITIFFIANDWYYYSRYLLEYNRKNLIYEITISEPIFFSHLDIVSIFDAQHNARLIFFKMPVLHPNSLKCSPNLKKKQTCGRFQTPL